MNKGLYIGSTAPYSGKTMLAIGIGSYLKNMGKKVGYYKPVSSSFIHENNSIYDKDSKFVKKTLSIETDINEPSSILITQDEKMNALVNNSEKNLAIIKDNFSKLTTNYDFTLVSGSSQMFAEKYLGIDGISVAKYLGIKTIIVERVYREVNYDILLVYQEYLKDNLAGVILNCASANLMDEINEVAIPFLNKKGIDVFGAIPYEHIINSITVKDISDSLGGRIVTAQENDHNFVDSFLIGSMQVENFTGYFRKSPNSAVIVGADRADVQLVAIEGNCPCLILTGKIFPNDIIISRAETLKVPVVLVGEDSFSVAKKIEYLLNNHKLEDYARVSKSIKLINDNINFNFLDK